MPKEFVELRAVLWIMSLLVHIKTHNLISS